MQRVQWFGHNQDPGAAGGSAKRGIRPALLLCGLLALAYCALFAHNSLVRFRYFSPDSMNYVDVARNLVSGRGLVQSAIGFNHLHFLDEMQWPQPFIAQPPLYPLLVAALALVGVEPADGALLIPALCHALLLGLAALFARRLGGSSAAFVAVAFLVWFFPLRQVCRFAWSDSLGALLTMAALWQMTPPERLRSFTPVHWILLGLTIGLAVSTRYALAPLALLAGFVALRAAGADAAKPLVLLGAGCAAPVAAVLANNLGGTGHLLPGHSPAPENWTAALKSIGDVLCGQYSDWIKGPAAYALWFIAVLLAAGIAHRRREPGDAARHLPVLLWIGGYLAFIYFLRVRVLLDDSFRLLFPALVAAAVVWASAIARVLPARWAAALCILSLAGGLVHELHLRGTHPPIDEARRDARIARNVIARQLTTDRDVIIGNDPLGIVFYVRRPHVISFSQVPRTDPPTYPALLAFLDHFADRYDRAFMLIRDFSGGSRAVAEKQYGPFIADLLTGQLDSYPRIQAQGMHGDTRVFTVSRKAP